MEKEYDLVVVGAGPGGSIAAKTAAELGLDVLLVEKRQEIGDPVRCAEGISKDSLRAHITPDPRWIAAEVSGSRIFTPDGSHIEMSERLSGGDVGYVLERKVFDRTLAQKAAAAGAEVMVKTRACSLLKKNGQVSGVKLMHLGETTDVSASLVIGADGIESKVGRWAGMDTSLRLSDVESCAQFLMTGIDVDRDFCHFYIGTGIAPGGYVWIFPKGEDTANVGIGVIGSKSGKVRAMSLLRDFVKKHLPDGKITEIVVGGVPVRGPIDRSVTDGLMLVGDAAHQANPLTGGGIANAMDAGKIAGEVAAKAIELGNVSAKVLMEYEQRWRAVIGEEIQKALIVKNKFLKLNDDDFNRLAGSLEGTNLEEMTVWGLLKALVRANPKLLWDLKDLV